MTPNPRHLTPAALAIALILPLTGQGVQADERLWANCRTCHAVTAPDGTQRARGGRSGPNLFGIAGRPLGGDASFRLYSDTLTGLGAAGRRWNQDDFIAYLAGPDQFLQSATGDQTVTSDMHVSMRAGGAELWAYLQTLSQ